MKKIEFVVLTLRLLGIYIFVIGLSSLPHFMTFFKDYETGSASYYLGPMIYLLSGAILFGLAPKISHFIIDFSEATDDSVQIAANETTARIALLILGIYLFAQNFPLIIQLSVDLGIYYTKMGQIEKHFRGSQGQWTHLISPSLKLIISISLIIGPDKIVGFLSKYDDTFRKVGTSNQKNSGDS